MPRRLIALLVAAVIAVAGLTGLIFGILLATSLAPPTRTTATVPTAAGVPVAETATGVLDLDGPQVQVRVTSPSGGPVFIGIARADDVTAYLADVSRTEITRVADDGTLTTVRAGSGPTLPDPTGADIWVVSRTGTGTASLTWPDTAGPWRLVVAGNGSEPAPEATLTWDRAHRTNSAPVVITVGVVLLAGGLVGLLVLRGRGTGEDEDDEDDAPTGRAPATVPAGVRTPASGVRPGDGSATRITPGAGTRTVATTAPGGIAVPGDAPAGRADAPSPLYPDPEPGGGAGGDLLGHPLPERGSIPAPDSSARPGPGDDPQELR